jgi:hypothetical protein
MVNIYSFELSINQQLEGRLAAIVKIDNKPSLANSETR